MTERGTMNARYRGYAAACTVILTALLLLPFARTAAWSDVASRIVIAGKTVTVAIAPYRTGDATIESSVDFVSAIGANYSVARDGKSVSVSKSGRTAVFPCRLSQGAALVAMGPIVQALGGVLDWDAASRTARILSRIMMVREDSDHLTVCTAYPVGYHIVSVGKPNRVYVDVYDASLGASPTTIPVSGDDVTAIRAMQTDATTVRVVVDLKRSLGFRLVGPTNSAKVEVALAAAGDNAGAHRTGSGTGLTHYVDDPSAAAPDSSNTTGSVSADTAPEASSTGSTPAAAVVLTRSGASAHITNIETNASIPGELRTTITVSGMPGKPSHAFLLDSPIRLVFDLPNTDFALTGDLASNSSDNLQLVNAIVKTIRWGVVDSKPSVFSGRVVFDLFRSDSYTVSSAQLPDGSQEYTVNLLLSSKAPTPNAADVAASEPLSPAASVPASSQPLPDVPDAVLSGKTVVVDPGHGGHDGGAPGVHGLWEKDITLAIGKALRDELVSRGAKVVMTREDDTFIELTQRAQIGIDNHADYFVSIHADSSGAQNSHNGTTVYYHANSATCHNLATAIANRLGQLNDDIHDLGTRSDYVRFPGVGFSVLRHSPEPAVLVETGYVNSDHDAAVLTDPAMQKLIAQGIAAGLKDFAAHDTTPTAQAPSPANSVSEPFAFVRQTR